MIVKSYKEEIVRTKANKSKNPYVDIITFDISESLNYELLYTKF